MVNSETNGDVDEVLFSLPNTTYASFSGAQTYTDTTRTGSIYSADVDGESAGSVTLSATGRMVSEGATCTATTTVAVSAPPPSVGWFQVVGGDVIAGNGAGDVISLTIPATCTAPTCTPVLIKDNFTPNGFSGVASAGGASVGVGTSGSVSAANWKVTNGPFLGLEGYNYAYFTRKIPEGCTPQNISGSSVTLSSGGATGGTCGSYFWFKKDSGALTITGPVNLAGRKVIVFSAGDVTISGDVNFNDGAGAFYLFAGGNINIAPAVGDAAATTPTPDVEGILFAGGQVFTGTVGSATHAEVRLKTPPSIGVKSFHATSQSQWQIHLRQAPLAPLSRAKALPPAH
ncbi:MAG: hypothetical protein AB1554_01965 [Chloroflexota bacterium]